MKNAYQDKMDAHGEIVKAKIMELKAKLKNATADARISIQRKIEELEQSIKNLS